MHDLSTKRFDNGIQEKRSSMIIPDNILLVVITMTLQTPDIARVFFL